MNNYWSIHTVDKHRTLDKWNQFLRFLRFALTNISYVILISGTLEWNYSKAIILNMFESFYTQPAKSLKSNTGGGSFCWIGIQYAMPYSQKYTPPHCFFCNFAGWVSTFRENIKTHTNTEQEGTSIFLAFILWYA